MFGAKGLCVEAAAAKRWSWLAPGSSPDHALCRRLVGLDLSQRSMALRARDRKRGDGGNRMREEHASLAGDSVELCLRLARLAALATDRMEQQEDKARLDPLGRTHFFLPTILRILFPGVVSVRIAASIANLTLPPASPSFFT